MCLAVPAKIVEVDATTDMAVVELDGIRKEVSTVLIEHAMVGDYVLIHVGFALERIDQVEAEKTLALFAELRAQDAGE
jgi:hydrogenase expression/formation protein HypC